MHPFNFLRIYLFQKVIEKETGIGTETNLVSTDSLLKWLQWPGLGQTAVWNQEFHPGLSCMLSSLPSQAQSQAVGLETIRLGLKPSLQNGMTAS